MKWWTWVLLVLAAAAVVIQFARPPRTNPPVDPAQTLAATVTVPADVQAILDRSCNDCHSNRTVWPWYSHIAPISWRLSEHVKDGRKELNFSEFGTYTAKRRAHKLEELCHEVRDKKMPLKDYLLLHPEAKLSDDDRTRLCEWTEELLAAPAS